jgi:hypothetical protein
MNRLIQPIVHPDADLLNAFAERTLPEAEGVQVMAHLAECGRCREVVFLAQAAAESEAAAAIDIHAGVHAEAQPARAHGLPGLLAKWRIAWIPAAALAAVGGVVLWVQMRPAPTAVTVARNETKPLSSAVTARPAVAAPAVTENQTAKSSARSENARPERKTAQVSGTQRKDRGREQSGSAVSAGEQRAPSEGSQATAAPVPAPAAVEAQPSAPSAQASLAATRWRPPQQPAGLARAGASPAEPANPSGGPAIISTHGTATPIESTAQTGLSNQVIQPARLGFRPQPLNGIMALKLARHPRLPSGLNAVSSAAVFDRLLAVDLAGALFLSHDAGKNWELVTTQWTGKAMEVIAQPRSPSEAAPAASDSTAESRPAAPPAPTSAGPAAPPVPALLFRLVNDRHQTWVSADGKVWRPE